MHRFCPPGALYQGSLVTIGNFDGVHLGHQALIRHAVTQARQQRLWADLVTFHPHPQTVLKNHRLPVITDMALRLRYFQSLGLDRVAVIHFTRDLARLSPQAFLQEYLLGRFNLRRMLVGYDFAFGQGRQGTPEAMARLGQTLGFTVEVFPEYRLGGLGVNSTRIRHALSQGDLATTALLLGHPYSVLAPVVAGQGRGRQLDFPTINLLLGEPLALARGVYASRVKVGEHTLDAVTNYGTRPTVDGRTLSLESHLLNYGGDLYGQTVEVFPLKKLREEQRFANVEALQAQIAQDCQQAKAWLAKQEGEGFAVPR